MRRRIGQHSARFEMAFSEAAQMPRTSKQSEPKPAPKLDKVRAMKTSPRGKSARRCGLCGRSEHLTRTPCCRQLVCDDSEQYVVFSQARNSCYHNHSRYTLCAYHHNEGHAGTWETCSQCRTDFVTELYVWYGTNKYNVKKLKTIPLYQPTTCAECGSRIRLGEDAYTLEPSGRYLCSSCAS